MHCGNKIESFIILRSVVRVVRTGGSEVYETPYGGEIAQYV
jgi:hypothetical protein